MRRGFTVIAVLAVLCAIGLGVLAMRGCTRGVKVADVLASPERYYGSEVRVEGVAYTGLPAVQGYSVYEIDDGSGKLWVVSRGAVPTDGQALIATGRVNKSLHVGSVSLPTHLVEEGRTAVRQ